MKSMLRISNQQIKLTLVFLLGLFLSFSSLASTIISTGAGGAWSTTTTWVGGVVPGTSDDVVINGPVYVNGSYICASVTINSSGNLLNAAYNYTLSVTGNVTNNGTVSKDPGWNFSFYIGGNIVNNGLWKPYQTLLNGTSNQYLSCGSGKKFEGLFNVTDTVGDIHMNSNLWFDNTTLDLANVKWYTDGYILKESACNFTNGRVFSNDTLDMNLTNFASIKVTGTFMIRGKLYVQANNVFNGTITILDTLLDNYYNYDVTINGNLINKGVIMQDPTNWNLSLYISGNIENYGVWRPYQTVLNGTGNQTIKEGAGKFYENWFTSSDTLGNIILASDVQFKGSTFYFSNSKLLTSGYKLYTLNYTINTARVITNDTLLLYQTHFTNTSLSGSYMIKGKLYVQSGNTFYGTVTLIDTLLDDGYHYDLTINGNIINKGAIIRDPANWNLSLYINGDIDNQGTWTPYQTILNGTGNQNIKETAGKKFQGWFSNADTLGDIILLSDVQFDGSTFYFANSKIRTNGFKLYTTNYILNAARIITNDTLLFYETRIINTTITGTFEIKGKLYVQSGNTFVGTVTLIDTLLDDYYHYDLTITGNLINKGVIRVDPANWNLSLYISGDIENQGIWRPYQTVLNGTGNQNIKEAAGKNYENLFSTSDTLGDMILQSPVAFTVSSWNLNNARLRTNTYKLTTTAGYFIYNARIISDDTLMLDETHLVSTSITGNFKLDGNLWVRAGNSFNGTVTILDTLRDDYYHYDLTINGSIINKGAILVDPNNWNLELFITGNIQNQGTWKPYRTTLNGSGLQTLGQSAGKKFECFFIISDTIGSVSLSSPVNFEGFNFVLGNETVLTNGFIWSSLNHRVTGGTIQSNDTINWYNTTIQK